MVISLFPEGNKVKGGTKTLGGERTQESGLSVHPALTPHPPLPSQKIQVSGLPHGKKRHLVRKERHFQGPHGKETHLVRREPSHSTWPLHPRTNRILLPNRGGGGDGAGVRGGRARPSWSSSWGRKQI